MAKMHTTVCYSRVPVPELKALGVLKPPMESDFGVYMLDVWPTHSGKNALVLRYSCTRLRFRHQQILDMGATYDYESYLPHITLSYDIGTDEETISNLRGRIVQFEDGSKIEIVEEYVEELKLDWSDSL